MKTLVYSKVGGETIATTYTLELNPGETVTSVNVGAVTPSDTSGVSLFVTETGGTLSMQIVGGNTGTTYGFPVTITTNQQVQVLRVAVTCQDPALIPYTNEDPNSYQDLMGTIQAGEAALASSTFVFDPAFDPTGGYVMWDILDPSGVVYSSGNAFEYKILSTGLASTVTAKSIVSTPTNMDPGQYQIRYTLRIGDGVAYNYETLNVVGMVDIQTGTQDSIEMVGDQATMSLVTEQLYQNYVLEVYGNNQLLASTQLANPERVSGGYYVGGTLDTSSLAVSLEPYQVVFKFWNHPSQTFRESAALWIVNPSIIQAMEDVKSKINKARQTLYGTPDSQFPSTEVMKWLRRGMDAFNAAYGVFTFFDMTNAKGAVREFWCLEAEKMALEAQYLMEGEKAFNFSGAAISLDVDRTSYLDSMASKIQSQLDSELKPLKQNLVMKGITQGDGSGPMGNGNFSVSTPGALGAVALAITPASIFNVGYGYAGLVKR